MLQTFDERSWAARSLLDVELYGVTCIGNLKGWAVGASGTIAHTENGGSDWSVQASHLMATLRGVRFADATHGVVCGDAGALAHTNDGVTWTLSSSGATPTTSDLKSVAATAAGTFFVASAGGVVLRSVDMGASFVPVVVQGAGDIEAVAATSNGDLVLAGDASGHIYASTDAGSSFHLEASAPASIEALSVAGEWASGGAWTAGTALAAGASGIVMRRGADGVWGISPSGTTVNLHAVLITDTLSYVAGDDGTLLALDGNMWSPIVTGTHASLNSLDDL